MASLARNIASEASITNLKADVAADGSPLDRNTASAYLDALAATFSYEPQPAWSVALRSRTRLRSQPKLHLSDPALACAALRLSPARLAGDPEYFGQVFESMAVRDLRAYLDADSGSVYQYRDSSGLDVDAILEFGDGGWAAIEVKLGSSRVPDAEASLLRLRDERVDLDRVGKPRVLALVTGTDHGYTLPSGVHVIPLGALTA